jgi:hypothetical protein
MKKLSRKSKADFLLKWLDFQAGGVLEIDELIQRLRRLVATARLDTPEIQQRRLQLIAAAKEKDQAAISLDPFEQLAAQLERMKELSEGGQQLQELVEIVAKENQSTEQIRAVFKELKKIALRTQNRSGLS